MADTPHVIPGLLLLALLSACGGRPAAVEAAAPAPATGRTGDEVVRHALVSALQARGGEAVAALRSVDSTGLSPRNAATRACMLERLGERRLPETPVAEPFLASILSAYREYWLRSILAERPPAENERWLLEALNGAVEAAGGAPAADLDALESPLDSLVRARGYHALLGVTSPLRELMLWRGETERRYEVRLVERTQPVAVVFLDDFTSLGWAGFATCDRHHSGGWTRPDRLYAVGSAYDIESENFRVSYLAHEAQHFADNDRFPGLERQEELEYRAKLAELALARSTAYELLDGFARNVSDDPGVPHSYANGRVARELAGRLFPDAGAAAGTPEWSRASVERINRAASELLREDTARRIAAAGAVR